MSTKLIIGIFSLLVIGSSVFAITRTDRPQTTVSQPQSQQQPPIQSTSQSSVATPSETGVYTPYTESAFAAATGKKVLYFHAPWCGQCRSIEAGIVPGAIPNNVTIFKVDYDSRQDLRKAYGVTMRTTFVVLDDNETITKRYVAYDDPYFESVKKQIF